MSFKYKNENEKGDSFSCNTLEGSSREDVTLFTIINWLDNLTWKRHLKIPQLSSKFKLSCLHSCLVFPFFFPTSWNLSELLFRPLKFNLWLLLKPILLISCHFFAFHHSFYFANFKENFTLVKNIVNAINLPVRFNFFCQELSDSI